MEWKFRVSWKIVTKSVRPSDFWRSSGFCMKYVPVTINWWKVGYDCWKVFWSNLTLPILFDLSGVICWKELALYSTYRVIQLIRRSTYQGYFLSIKRKPKPKEMRKFSRSEDFDLIGSRLIEVQLYLLLVAWKVILIKLEIPSSLFIQIC